MASVELLLIKTTNIIGSIMYEYAFVTYQSNFLKKVQISK